MRLLIGILIVAISGGLGMFLDICLHKKDANLYWLIGLIGGLVAGIVIASS